MDSMIASNSSSSLGRFSSISDRYTPRASAIAAVGALDPASKGKSETIQDKNRRVVIVLIP